MNQDDQALWWELVGFTPDDARDLMGLPYNARHVGVRFIRMGETFARGERRMVYARVKRCLVWKPEITETAA